METFRMITVAGLLGLWCAAVITFPWWVSALADTLSDWHNRPRKGE